MIFSQNTTVKKAEYGDWRLHITGIPNTVSANANYYTFTAVFRRTVSTGGYDEVYPELVKLIGNSTSWGSILEYDVDYGEGRIAVTENLDSVEMRQFELYAEYDFGQGNIQTGIFTFNQEAQSSNIHVVWTNLNSSTFNVEFSGNIELITNNSLNDAKGNFDINYKEVPGSGAAHGDFIKVGYIDLRNGSDTCTGTKVFSYKLTCYVGGSNKPTSTSIQLEVREHSGYDYAPKGRLITSSNTVNLTSGISTQTATFTFDKSWTIDSNYQIWINIITK